VIDEDSERQGPLGVDQRRLDAEWATLIAIREVIGVGLKGKSTPTYGQALQFAKTISPTLFDSESTVLGSKERDIVREYRQRAEAESSLKSRAVTPVEVVEKEIKAFKAMLDTPGDRHLIEKRLNNFGHIRQLLQPRKYSENQLILRDLFKAHRELPGPPTDGDTYREFQLDSDRGLRIRLLHPDKPEHTTGADLIYENYWDKQRVVRMAFVQYKVWNGSTLYSSKAANLEEQLKRLKTVVCDKGYCRAADEQGKRYRLPYCAAFVRPSDQLQDPDSRLISSGLHVPICRVVDAWEETGRGGKKIERKRIRSEALSPKVFEELLNSNMLGSRWLSYNEVEEIYRTHKIFDSTDRILVHAQEFGI